MRASTLVLSLAAWSICSTTLRTAVAQATRPADDVLKNMLREQPRAAERAVVAPPNELPTTDATSGKGATAPAAPAVSVIREGTYIVDRVGRLVRAVDGQQWEFAFDADGRALRDPPVVVLPNLKLMAMESALTGSTRDLRFRITGMVTEYRGRNHVLLEKAVVVPATGQF